jgi:DNA-binding CsgD family transcriptional regulator/ribosomal 30S subunit maturation factor RimM
MTFEVSYNKKQELFDQHLKLINDINFTYREIDVIACILHQRGEKKIASLLSISPRTVGAHIHNIILKLGYSSREYIIDFIEKSGKVQFIRQYYFLLLIENLFKTNLVKIGKIVNRQGINCHVNYKESYLEKKSILNQIKRHLELANISLNFPATANQEVTPNFCILSPDNYQDNHRPIILIIDKQNISIESQDYEYLDFSKEDEYYLAMFSLLQIIIPKSSLLEETIEHFIKEYKAIIISFEDKTQIDNSTKFSLNSILIKKKSYLVNMYTYPYIWLSYTKSIRTRRFAKNYY